jgi:hypothetical protein
MEVDASDKEAAKTVLQIIANKMGLSVSFEEKAR